MSQPEPEFVLYGAGDAGTAELRRHLAQKRVKFVFNDTRDGWMNRANLRFVLDHKFRTLPQLFHKGELVGDGTEGFECARRFVLNLPEPEMPDIGPAYA